MDMDTVSFYECNDLKLSALLLTKIPGSSFETYFSPDSYFATIKIRYPTSEKSKLDLIITEFLRKTAQVDVFFYNKNLRLIRNSITNLKAGFRSFKEPLSEKNESGL